MPTQTATTRTKTKTASRKTAVAPKPQTDRAAKVGATKAVDAYLRALENTKPRRGRKPDPDALRRKVAVAAADVTETSGLAQLVAMEKRNRLEQQLEDLEQVTSLVDLEAGFVEAAAIVAEAKGLSRQTFREFGVPADVLDRAGVK